MRTRTILPLVLLSLSLPGMNTLAQPADTIDGQRISAEISGILNRFAADDGYYLPQFGQALRGLPRDQVVAALVREIELGNNPRQAYQGLFKVLGGETEAGRQQFLIGLEDPDWRIRRTAATGLIVAPKDQHEAVVGHLGRRLQMEDRSEVKRALLRTLSKIGTSTMEGEFFDDITALFLDPNSPDRVPAAKALLRIAGVAKSMAVFEVTRDSHGEAVIVPLIMHAMQTGFMMDTDASTRQRVRSFVLRAAKNGSRSTRYALIAEGGILPFFLPDPCASSSEQLAVSALLREALEDRAANDPDFATQASKSLRLFHPTGRLKTREEMRSENKARRERR